MRLGFWLLDASLCLQRPRRSCCLVQLKTCRSNWHVFVLVLAAMVCQSTTSMLISPPTGHTNHPEQQTSQAPRQQQQQPGAKGQSSTAAMSAPAGSSASKKRLSSGVALSPHGGGVVSECVCVCACVSPRCCVAR